MGPGVHQLDAFGPGLEDVGEGLLEGLVEAE